MASPYPAFIFQDAIPAQQMMAHAQAVNEGQRIQELGKARQAEGMFRMAQLQQQQKAQKDKTDLDRMIAESQIQQAKIGNEFKNKELAQRGSLTEKGYDTDIKVAEIRAKAVDPRLAINEERQKYDAQLAQKEEAQDQVLIREWQMLRAEAAAEQSKLDATMPGDGFLGFGKGPYNARVKENEQATKRLSDITQRMTNISNILAQRGKVPTPNRVVPSASVTDSAPPPAYQLQPVAPADPRVDAIKRGIAKFIQDGGDPSIAYERARQLGVDLR